jgi:hypothetical protein
MREYIPEILKSKEKIKRRLAFGVGEEERSNEFGMWAGPFDKEEDALEEVGRSRKSCIIRFNEDDTDNITWRWLDDRWVAL